MFELTPQQMMVIERLFEAGFRPIAIPPYESALCMHRGDCAALLAPVPNGGLRLLAAPTYLLDGSLSVRVTKNNRDLFVFKQKEMEATPAKLAELDKFRSDLNNVLGTIALPS